MNGYPHWILAALLLGASPTIDAQQRPPHLYERIDAVASRAAGSYAWSSAFSQELPAPGASIALPVPDGADIEGTVDRVEEGYAGVRVLVGHVDDGDAMRRFFVAVGPDGSLFVSEDQGGAIYRIRPAAR